MNKKNKKPELIAPAGNLEKMKIAFAFGADAVYAGIPDFSLRVRINDFTIAKLGQAIKYAHKQGKKIYVTINIFAHNKHIEKLPAYVKKLKEINSDGLIVSDPGVLQVVKKIWPKANIHLSTQANCANWQAAKFWHEQGIKRIILARELGIKEIAEIHKKVPKLELECFVHGALCMAYSGRCFLSKFFRNRDANLGDCVQPCRWKYLIPGHSRPHLPAPSPKQEMGSNNPSSYLGGVGGGMNEGNYGFYIKAKDRDEILELVEEEHGSYILNSQDLCLIKRLDELEKAGVSAFKIEGRAKSVYYIANVVGAYAKAIDNLIPASPAIASKVWRAGLSFARRGRNIFQEQKEVDFLYKELEEKLCHRGYTEGFMFGDGKMAQNIEESHKKCDWEFCGQTGCRMSDVGCRKKFQIQIQIHNSLKLGDEVEIIMPKYDIIKMRIDRMADKETGEELKQAHGGQGRVVVVESDVEVPEFSVVRRNVNKKQEPNKFQ